jgi:hypothetical protein
MRRAMRSVAVIAIALATGSCLEPGERDPTRYPWDAKAQPKATYCVVALKQPASRGIVIGGGNTVNLGCTPPASAAAKPKAEPIVIAREIGPGITEFIRIPNPTPEQRAAYEAQQKKAAEPKWIVAETAAPPREPTPRERFVADCSDHSGRLAKLRSRYPIEYSGAKARVERTIWDGMPLEDRNALIWGLAFHASCAADRYMMVEVRIADREGGLLRNQRVSTELTCHGDRIGGPPDAPWYRC